MKFSEMPYKRPDVEEFKNAYMEKVRQFEHATSGLEQIEIWKSLEQIELQYDIMPQLVSIRKSLNTNDPLYAKEQEYWDEILPALEELAKEFRRVVLISKFRDEIKSVFGEHIYNLYEVAQKTFSTEIIEDMQIANEIDTKYSQMVWSAEIPFRGETHDLSTIDKFLSEGDRELRYEAAQAKFKRYEDHDAEHNKFYDQIVEVCVRQANKLGYPNYIRLAYDEMSRIDYTPEDIAAFRSHIEEFVVPVCQELLKEQAAYIGVDTLYYHDEIVLFPEWNPKPIWTPQELLEKWRKMYQQLSPETAELYDLMMENELFDVLTKPGKEPWGYATTLDLYKVPFIFANFVGTSADTDVLTHEFGHVFQMWKSFAQPISDYESPSMETAEVHSMSMEFFTMPRMKDFYGENTFKYQYKHLAGCLKFLPYSCAVDEFQHRVFEQAENPQKSYQEIYLPIEKKYLPHRKYLNNPYVAAGNQWKQKHHIFNNPFYYIDYALAQICALQFWMKSEENFDQAWKDYVKLCTLGGSKPYKELLKEVGLESPFERATIEKTINFARNWLKTHPLKK